MFKLAHIANSLLKLIKSPGKVLFFSVIAALLLFATYIIVSTCSASKEHPSKVNLEDTPIVIDSVRPTGELYVSSAILEDYVTEQKTERNLLVFTTDHACVQIVKFKCSYVLNLDKIGYEVKDDNTIIATLPPLETKYSLQESPFMSDDESYWAKVSTNEMKKKAEAKVKSNFDTEENRNKSTLYAEAAMRVLLKKLGYENVEFITTIQQKPKN